MNSAALCIFVHRLGLQLFFFSTTITLHQSEDTIVIIQVIFDTLTNETDSFQLTWEH